MSVEEEPQAAAAATEKAEESFNIVNWFEEAVKEPAATLVVFYRGLW
jgi:hypothetical protein